MAAAQAATAAWHNARLQEFMGFPVGISAMGAGVGRRDCNRCATTTLNFAGGEKMDMPLWYWQICFGALVIVLTLAHEID